MLHKKDAQAQLAVIRETQAALQVLGKTYEAQMAAHLTTHHARDAFTAPCNVPLRWTGQV